ncbi:MAG: glycosyltransferase family 39 protein [Synechococcales cyanobacterium M58_A2018_015]|nr:glycosyltransferase family 39 protein [Synechococcales cyanobacterium M58_A2018_015]
MGLRMTSFKNWLDRWHNWAKQPHWILPVAWVLLLTGIAVWLQLGSTGLVDETEPLFAEAARQMQLTGDWITPYFNEQTRFDKPPLVYWIMALAYSVVGVNEWAVRFPSALAATVLTAFGFYTLRYFGFPRPGQIQTAASQQTPLRLSAWIGAACMALNLQTIAWGRIGISDMLLSSCIGAALLAFFWGYAHAKPSAKDRWYLASYIFSALAVLAKGPVGVVLPGLIVLAFLIYLGNLRSVISEMRLLRGSLIFLAITLPWYILVIWANGEDYIESFFGYHNVERFTRVVNNHWAPIWFYLVIVPLAFLPWSAYLPVAMARLRFWRWRMWQQQPRSAHLGIFALIWFAVIFGFFTIAATKLPSYTIPLLPAAAILVALFWSDQMTQSPQSTAEGRGVRISHIANSVLMLLLAAVLFYSPNWLGNEPEMPNLPEVVRQSGVTLWGGAIWLSMGIAALVLMLRQQGRWIWSTTLIGFMAFTLLTILPVLHIVDVERQLPLRQLSATIVQVQKPEEQLLMIGFRKPSIVFYAQRPVTFISAPSEVAEEIFRLSRRLSRRNANVNSLLIIGRPVKWREAGIQPQHYQTLAEAGVFRLARMEFPPGSPPLRLQAED